jgi:hypothetical protein
MIPSDLAARLRFLSEASFFDSEPPVQGTAKVREIQARLPQLLPGQQFSATLQRPLPDGTFQAIVAGRNYTLALNHAAKPGDTLELVVTKNTPKAIFAQLANPTAASVAAENARPNLSPTGRLISFLLTGQPAPQPAQLAAGKPLLTAPPAGSGASLAPLLRQALAQSGLFYESHQLQWLSGKLDTAGLLKEPQGQHGPYRPPGALSNLGSAPAAAGTGLPQAPGTASNAGSARPGANLPPINPVSGVAESTQERVERLTQAGQSASLARSTAVPERLMPIVHQQLDAMATQNYVLHALAWPGQKIEWEIEDPEREAREDDDAAEDWNTTLRLTMPRLGRLEAQIRLTSAGITLRLQADDPRTVGRLEADRASLEQALAAANVPLTGFIAERRHEG